MKRAVTILILGLHISSVCAQPTFTTIATASSQVYASLTNKDTGLDFTKTLVGSLATNKFVLDETEIEFNPRIELELGFSTPFSADLDNDGKADLIKINSSTISILRNTSSVGLISYAAKVDFNAIIGVLSIAVEDLDGDGKGDLILRIRNGVVILKNSSVVGHIDFETPQFHSNNTEFHSITISDLDGDGSQDIVLASSFDSAILFFILRNKSTSGIISFAEGEYIILPHASANLTMIYISAGDLDGDGKEDLVVVNQNRNSISIYRNTSSGIGNFQFADKIDFETGEWPQSVSIADLDNDGKADLVLPNMSDNTISVFKNVSAGDGLIDFTRIELTTGREPIYVLVRDLDRNDKLDLVVTNRSDSSISIFRNISTEMGVITYTPKTDYEAISNPWSVSISDIDGDGKSDLLIGNLGGGSNFVSFFLNSTKFIGSPSITSFTPLSGSGGTSVVIAGTNFIGTSAVSFGGTPAAAFVVNSSTKLTAIIGTGGSSGLVSVTNADGTATATGFIYNSPPVITSFSPGSAEVGTSIIINGSNFNGNSVNNIVVFGTTRATVIAASETQLTVTVPPGATHAPITVLNAESGLLTYSSQFFFPTFSRAKSYLSESDFEPKISFASGREPASLVLGDFDHDGKSDMAVVNSLSHSVSIFRNTSTVGNISYSKIDINDVPYPTSVSIGDLDGDGKIDLVVKNDHNTISVLRNTSTGVGNINFAAKIDILLLDVPVSVSCWDFDGDGKVDLAVILDYRVDILRNISEVVGNIKFNTTPIVLQSVGVLRSASIGDLDGDGKGDIAITSYSNPGSKVSLFRNTSTVGTISFASRVDLTFSGKLVSGSIGDLDGDSKVELIVGSEHISNSKISVYRNMSITGNFNFATRVDFEAAYLSPISLADLNGDGKLDIVMGSSVLSNTSTGVGDIGFGRSVTAYNGWPTLAVGDLDGDGKPDLMFLNDDLVSVIRNNPYLPSNPAITSFTPTSGDVGTAVTITGSNFSLLPGNNIVNFGATRATVTAATSNQLIVTVPAGATYAPISVLNIETGLLAHSVTNFIPTFSPNKGTISASDFTTQIDFPLNPDLYSWSSAINDFDNDGKPDIVVTHGNRYSTDINKLISVFRNTSSREGNISFAQSISFPTGGKAYNISSADLDGDGSIDLVIGNHGISVLRNMTSSFGHVFFETHSYLNTDPADVSISDMDNDGRADIVYLEKIDRQLMILRNISSKGNILFANPKEIGRPGVMGPLILSLSDLDGDGRTDVVVGDSNFGKIQFFRNLSLGPGNIDFGGALTEVGDFFYTSIHISDFDGDGKGDLVFSSDVNIVVFRNTSVGIGDISFSDNPDFRFNASTLYSVSIADLNGDSKLDLVLSSYTTPKSSLLLLSNISTGVGNINFAERVEFNTAETPSFISIGDLDGDGKPDLVSNLSQKVSVFRNSLSLITSTEPSVSTDFFSLYPNPVDDWLTLFFESENKKEIAIHQSTGVQMTKQITFENEVKIKVADYPAGLYIVRVSTPDSQETLKFIKR